MPRLEPYRLSRRYGETGINEEVPGVIEAPSNWRYTYTIATGSGNLPGIIQLSFTQGRLRLVGRAPNETERVAGTYAERTTVTLQADSTDDPDAPYTADLYIEFRSNEATRAALEATFNAVSWRNIDALKRGLPHSDPQKDYLLMGLPLYANPLSGILAPEVNGEQRQWLVLDGVQQMSMPLIASGLQDRPLGIGDGDYIAPDEDSSIFVPPGETTRPADLRFTAGIGQSRGGETGSGSVNAVLYRPARVRVLWNDRFASHGGPYGLLQASLNGGIILPWALYQRDFDTPANGKVLMSWEGFVSRFVRTTTRRGVIADAHIACYSGLTTYRSNDWVTTPLGGPDEVFLLNWPAPP